MNNPDGGFLSGGVGVRLLAGRRRLLVVTFLSALVLGVIGFLQLHQHAPEGEAVSAGRAFLNALYHTAQLFILHTPLFSGPVPLALEFGRWLAALTTIMAGAAVARRIFQDEWTDVLVRRARKPVIVCGLGRKGIGQVRRLRKQARHVIVIEKAPDPAHADECRRWRVPIVVGDATQAETLKEAGILNATALYAMCPDDRTNCQIAAQVSQFWEGKSEGNLECHIHLADVDLRAALQEMLSSHTDGTTRVNFRFFDVFEPEARQLLVHDLPLDHDGVSVGETRGVHLVILGFGRMGRTLAVRAAQLGCFANRKPLSISVIDKDAARHRDELLFRHRSIETVCHWRWHALDAISPDAWKLLESWCVDGQNMTSVVVCFDDEPKAIEIAFQFLPLLTESRVRFAVRLSHESGLANLLEAVRRRRGHAEGIHPFGMEERWCRLFNPEEDINEDFARRIHAEYERLIRATGEGSSSNPARDTDAESIATWLALPEDFRESSRQQAAHIFIKLRAIGCEAVPLSDPREAVSEFAPEEVEMLADLEHERWVAERTVANWVYAAGPKDVRRRTNENLVPWDELTHEIKEYDREFVRMIPRLLQAVGQKVCRREPSRA